MLLTTQRRQIRNAFQTAIALVEHDALHSTPDSPAPALGAAQFEIVAKASQEFEEYLTLAIGRGETDLAIHDKWRADPYGGVLKPVKRKGKAAAAKVDDSEDDESSEDSSSDDDLVDDEDEDNDMSGKTQGGKAAKGGSGKDRSGAIAAVEAEAEEDQMAQFEAFMKFQAMKKSKGAV